jgi:hypothetical protein
LIQLEKSSVACMTFRVITKPASICIAVIEEGCKSTAKTQFSAARYPPIHNHLAGARCTLAL